jgi:hypothetical protein
MVRSLRGGTSAPVACALCAALALVWSPDAPAQGSGTSRHDREEARQWYRSGRELLQNGEAEAALANFETAYGLYPHWASMVGMGLAYEALGQHEQALVCFEQGLEDGGDEIRDAERADIESRIASLRAQGASYVVAPVPVVPQPFPVPAGQTAGAAGGEEEISPWFWGLLAVAAAVGIGGIATGSYALVLDDEYHDPATTPARLDQIRPTGEALQVTTDVLLGVAGAAAIAALVVLFSDGDEESGEAAVLAPGPAPGVAGVGLTIAF